ncbi:MAG: hypothetical protein R3F33_18050 [Planctomycetota bacterium]
MKRTHSNDWSGGWASGAVGLMTSGAFLLGSLVGHLRAAQPTKAIEDPPKTVQAQAFEVVDAKGHVLARLTSNANGGNLALYRDLHEEDPYLFAYLGCPQSGVEFMMRDPTKFTDAGIFMDVFGKPAAPHLCGKSDGQTSLFSLGPRRVDGPMLSLRRLADGELYWEK